jgi:hypothetical protein
VLISPGTKGPLKDATALAPPSYSLTINSRFFSLGDVLILRVFTILVVSSERRERNSKKKAIRVERKEGKSMKRAPPQLLL